MCANDDGYAGSGWVEASVPELLGSGDDRAVPCEEDIPAFGCWDSLVDRADNQDLNAAKSRAGASFFFLRKNPVIISNGMRRKLGSSRRSTANRRSTLLVKQDHLLGPSLPRWQACRGGQG